MSKVIIKKKYIQKYFLKKDEDLFHNEIFWLKKLEKYDQIPKIIDKNTKELSLKITNNGKIVSAKNLPQNWEKQLKDIQKILIKNDCFHGDITPNNIVSKNKKISLIDFAQATHIKKFNIRKKRIFDDFYCINRISLMLNNKKIISNDLRILTIWNSKHEKYIRKKITNHKKLQIIDRIQFSKNFYKDIRKDRILWLDNFYNRYIDRKTNKLKNSITCYLILNKNPIFKKEKMIFTHETRIIDSDIFNFKKKIRRKRKNIIHISDNFEEAKRNALFLSKSKFHYPYKLFLNTQTIHSSLKEFFKKINNTKNIEYVLLRSKYSQSDDLDILVNNYHLFKRIADAHSYKLKNLSFFSNNGDPVEDYGFKVSNYININKRKICLDIRYVGDNYLDKNWQANILKNKIFYKNIFIPSKKDQLYSILYHIIFHKGFINKKYLKYLKKNFNSNYLNISFLKKDTQKFLTNNKYKIVRANDLTIAPIFKLSKNQKATEFDNIQTQMSKNNFSCANKLLFNLIKLDFNNFLSLKFIFLILKNNFKYLLTLVKKIFLTNISREKLKF